MDNCGIEYTDEELEELQNNVSNNDEVQALLEQATQDTLREEVDQIYDNLEITNSSRRSDKTEKIKEIKNKFILQKKGIDVFCDNSKADINIKKFLSRSITIILAIQVLAIDRIFMAIGLGILKYSEQELQLFVNSIFLEIIGLVGVIVSYIFKDNIKDTVKTLLSLSK